MREPLQPFSGVSRLNYLCIIASELLGQVSLAAMPTLAAGFESVTNTLSDDVALALRNVRLAGIAPGTLSELHLMADAYRQHYRQVELRKSRGDETAKDELPQRYRIDENLNISRTWTHLVPDDITIALACLTSLRPLRLRAIPPFMHPISARRSTPIRVILA